MLDLLTLLEAALGGAFNGTFPVFIKTNRVLAANVHPVVFQLYKSSCVCIFGLGLLAVRAMRGLQPAARLVGRAHDLAH